MPLGVVYKEALTGIVQKEPLTCTQASLGKNQLLLLLPAVCE